MAFWNFVIYHVSDFSTLDWNSGATTNATLNPIYVTIEDDDAEFRQQGADPGMLQTISSSSEPGLVGQNIFFDVTGTGTQLWDTSSGTLMLGAVRIGGLTDWVVATQDGANTTLSPGTTYNEDQPLFANLGLTYATAAMPCFTAGTRILTPKGEVPVETLQKGDRVLTADSGLQPIRWIGQRSVTAADLRDDPRLRPVRIAAGAMGCGLPARDLSVSRQHRMLVRSDAVEALFGTREALVPAIKLVGLPGIEIDRSGDAVTYVHFLFKRHEVVFAEGCPTESLHLGPQLRDPAADEILSIFPELTIDTYALLPARLLVKGPRAGQLTDRLRADSGQPLQPSGRLPEPA